MVGDPRLLILLPLETRQVAPDNTVVLTLKTGNQTYVAPYSTDNRSKLNSTKRRKGKLQMTELSKPKKSCDQKKRRNTLK